jgi:hypothetical protein
VLRDVLRLDAPELDAHHVQLDVRTATLRVGLQRGKNVASDYALLQRASPFLHRLSRPALTILLEGDGRFEEGARRAWLRPGDVALSDQARGGTEAYAGATCRWLVLDWDPTTMGAKLDGDFRVERLSARDRARLDRAAVALEGPDPATAVAAIVDVLRGWGLPFERPRADVGALPDPDDHRLLSVVGDQLSHLRAHPALDDVTERLGWNLRRVNRRVISLADDYHLPWGRWRDALHHTRVLQALRLLAAPGATTETVARLTGFRAPTALCHTFAAGGLPSPGVLARAATRDVLDRWTHEIRPRFPLRESSAISPGSTLGA